VLGNSLMIAGLGLALSGIRLYKGLSPAFGILIGGIVATAFLAWLFSIYMGLPNLRITYVSGAFAIISLLAVRELLRSEVAQPLRSAYWITGGAFTIYSIAMFIRLLFLGYVEGPMDPFAPSLANILTFAAGGFAQLATTFGFILMVHYRMAMELERIASVDALTGALNRRSLERRASRIAARGDGQPVAVIMLDIDHFKLINDRYGHPAGDFVLQEVTQLARHQLREHDLFARMGGEEFCVILAESDEATAIIIAERIRAACSQQPLIFNNTPIQFTLSAGVSAAPVFGGALEELIGEADHALYHAKQSGRDRVEAWSRIAAHSQAHPAQRIAPAEHAFP